MSVTRNDELEYVDSTARATRVLSVDAGGNPLAPALPTSSLSVQIPATLSSTQVPSPTPAQRDSLSIYNSATSGVMYVRLGAAVDVAQNEWDYAVPSEWLWVCPRWGGDVFIAWDDASDGFGHVAEVNN